jgi:hypothetical protein
MNDRPTFKRVAAISTIIAGLLILASIVVLSMVVDFNVEFLDKPAGLITAGLGASAVGLFRWGSILELFGYFLLLIPAALYLWHWLSPRSSGMATLYTVLGLAGILLGVVEEAIRVSFFPSMMLADPQAAEAQRAVLEAIFNAVVDFNFENLYALNPILAGVWWLGIGLVLRGERRSLGVARSWGSLRLAPESAGSCASICWPGWKAFTSLSLSGRCGSALPSGGAPVRARKGWKREGRLRRGRTF